MPHYGYPRLGELRLIGGDGAPSVAPIAERRPHLVVYGSSISQCREAPGPTETWPALVARSGGWNLRCLGFGAQCHLDPTVARFIRDSPADLIVLGVGINIYGAASFSARSLGPALEGFIATIRSGHPATPIVVVTPIVSPDREASPNSVGLTLADIRALVAQTARQLSRADPHLTLVDGLSILGADDAHLLVDGLHPGPEGYALIAERMLARLDPLAALPR